MFKFINYNAEWFFIFIFSIVIGYFTKFNYIVQYIPLFIYLYTHKQKITLGNNYLLGILLSLPIAIVSVKNLKIIPLTLILIILIKVIFEEILFRGIIFKYYNNVIIASVYFSLAHIFVDNFNLAYALFLFWFSIVQCLLYKKTSLSTCIAFHFMWNFYIFNNNTYNYLVLIILAVYVYFLSD